jgi:hypothetical protein
LLRFTHDFKGIGVFQRELSSFKNDSQGRYSEQDVLAEGLKKPGAGALGFVL